MKAFKSFLHVLIASVSVVSFLGGWIALAHSKKPVQSYTSQSIVALPTLAPIPALGSLSVSNSNSSGQGNGLGILMSSNNNFMNRPLFRTGGS